MKKSIRGAMWLMFLLAVALLERPTHGQRKEKMPETAQQYIAAFERGEDFSPPAIGLLVNGQPDPGALSLLGQQLATAHPRVRENIVHLLVAIGRQSDPLTPKGADVLRNKDILVLLSGPGLSKHDLGRVASMDALRKLAMPADLHRLGDVFTRNLQMAPSDDAFLLVAKAKPENAGPVVNELALSPAWRNNESAAIAQAALGNATVEASFLAQATKAESKGDGQALSHALGSLGLIGTPVTLKAVAERLRTPLTTEVPHAFERSDRLSALEALLYNFPNEPVLYPNNIVTEANYQDAEHFCEKTFGVTYKTPPPPFMTIRGYPMPIPF